MDLKELKDAVLCEFDNLEREAIHHREAEYEYQRASDLGAGRHTARKIAALTVAAFLVAKKEDEPIEQWQLPLKNKRKAEKLWRQFAHHGKGAPSIGADLGTHALRCFRYMSDNGIPSEIYNVIELASGTGPMGDKIGDDSMRH